MQSSCTICYEPLNHELDIVTTVCGHVFHLNCISQWLNGNGTCPKCRRIVEENSLIKLFLNSDDISDNNLEQSLNELKTQLHERDLKIVEHEKKIEELQASENNLKLSLDESKIQLHERDLKIVEYEKKIEELQVSENNLKLSLDESKKQLHERDLKIVEYEKKIEELQASDNNLRKSLEESKKQLHERDLKIVENEKKIKKFQLYHAHSEKEKIEIAKNIRLLLDNNHNLGRKYSEDVQNLQNHCTHYQEENQRLHQDNQELKSENITIKRENENLSHIEAENQRLLQDKNFYENQLDELLSIKEILEGTSHDTYEIVQDVLELAVSEEEKVVAIAKYCSAVKHELNTSEEKIAHLQNELAEVTAELRSPPAPVNRLQNCCGCGKPTVIPENKRQNSAKEGPSKKMRPIGCKRESSQP